MVGSFACALCRLAYFVVQLGEAGAAHSLQLLAVVYASRFCLT